MTSAMHRALNHVTSGRDLSPDLAGDAMRELMSGQCSNAAIGGFLSALALKGETSEEIASFAQVMRERSRSVNPDLDHGLVDVCGTGGAKLKTFNISTISAFVSAGAGCPVAKHGNRSNTSKSGSADLLETLGVNLDSGPELIKRSIEEIGIGFLYAPKMHPAMKHAAQPRKQLGIRSVFNILGPLTNPAGADYHLMGVFNPRLVDKFPSALRKIGVDRALVVYGEDGMDEISTSDHTYVGELKHGEVRHYRIHPHDFGMDTAPHTGVSDLSPEESARVAVEILSGQRDGHRRDIVVLNAAAGLFAAGRVENIAEGIRLSLHSIESGHALQKLVGLIERSGGSLEHAKEFHSGGSHNGHFG